MPVYNAEKYISEAIESILIQTYQNFEFLIFNDGSTDNSAAIIQSYKDDRIKFFNYTQNAGYVVHLNYGISIAEGQYIARMDADDISHPERLQKQVQFMEANGDVGVCGTWFDIIGTSCSTIQVPSEHEELKTHLLFNSVFGHPTVIIRLSILRENSLFYDQGYMPAEDFKLWVELSKVCRLANLTEVLLHYRIHDGQISNCKKQVQLDKVQAVRELQIEYLLDRKLTVEDHQSAVLLFGALQPVYDAKSFSKMLDFAKKLLDINSVKKCYDPETSEEIIVARIKTLMARLKYKPTILFKEGKSLVLAHLNPKEKIKFCLKCLFNWQPENSSAVQWIINRFGVAKALRNS